MSQSNIKSNPYTSVQATVKLGPYGLVAVTVNGQTVYFNGNGTYSKDGGKLSTGAAENLLGLEI